MLLTPCQLGWSSKVFSDIGPIGLDLQRLKRTLLPAEEATPSCLGSMLCHSYLVLTPNWKMSLFNSFLFLVAFLYFMRGQGWNAKQTHFSIKVLAFNLWTPSLEHRISSDLSAKIPAVTVTQFTNYSFSCFFWFPRHVFISFSKGKDLKLQANETR